MLAPNGERKFMSDLFGFGDRSCKCTLIITTASLYIAEKYTLHVCSSHQMSCF